jgi:hypothetical protein
MRSMRAMRWDLFSEAVIGEPWKRYAVTLARVLCVVGLFSTKGDPR